MRMSLITAPWPPSNGNIHKNISVHHGPGWVRIGVLQMEVFMFCQLLVMLFFVTAIAVGGAIVATNYFWDA